MNSKNSKEIILNQALVVFGKYGFQKTTMGHIAEAADRGRRTIYTYFKNKEEIYEAVIEREIDRLISQLKSHIDKAEGLDNKVKAYITYRMKALISLTNKFDALKLAYLNNFSWVEKIRTKLDAEERLILSQLLDSGLNNGTFDIPDKVGMQKTILLIIKSIEPVLIGDNSSKNINAHIANLQQLILYGIMHR